MRRRPPRSTRTDSLFPYTTHFLSIQVALGNNFLLSGAIPGLPDRVATGLVISPENVGYAIAVEIAYASNFVCLLINSYDCLLSGAVPGLPDRVGTCPCIAPQDVGYAISIEIADPNHGPCLISYVNNCLLSGAISRLPEDRKSTRL